MNKSGLFHAQSDGFLSLDSGAVLALVANSSDHAVVLDKDLVVSRVIIGAAAQQSDTINDLIGRSFISTLTSETVPKFDEMVAEARLARAPRWRQLNHLTLGDLSLPVIYAAVAHGDALLLVGRDRRELASVQQRLVQAQMTIEQDYERIRQAESRYRVLFETDDDALAILGTDAAKIVDANAAAAGLLGRDAADLTGRSFINKIAPDSQPDLTRLLDTVRTKGGQHGAALTLKNGSTKIWLEALLFRSVADTLILCRLRPHDGSRQDGGGADDPLARLYHQTGDAIVFTDMGGTILRCNGAFHELANVAVAERLREENLADFLGRPSVDLQVMTSNAIRAGKLSVYATTLRSEYGAEIPVEISTTHLPDQDPPGFAFIIRDVTRLEASRQSGAALTNEAVEHVIELVGSTPLKELVRSTTDVVEKLCIETALRLTSNNRAAAAEMLGLSRQSLYVKLRRFGLIVSDD
ncbi:MAG: transcriptional regulator PpsR [Pseudomonadota bacterium]